jgi:serine/threonine protein kinase
MTTQCPDCGGEIQLGAPAGLCPKCLYQVGLPSGTEAGGPSSSALSFVPPTAEDLAPHFQAYEILGLIGQGGMGGVYKAYYPALDRMVAIKILPASDPQLAERFQREAKALARLSHPHIVAVFDVGRSGPWLYMVMEHVEGVNLRQAMRSGAMTPIQALVVVPQMCDALQYAHDTGIVHRDIKPENILLDMKGRVKIADFGLAKLLDAKAADPSLTATHQVMGTLRYMAPEQMLGTRDVDHRADIYSLGVVFYELLTGELPLGRFAPPSQKVQIDVRLDEVVLRALEQKPEQRFQHVSEVKTQLEVIARPGFVAPAAVPGVPASKLTTTLQRCEAHWRTTPGIVRQAVHISLAIVYLYGLICVFSFSAGKEHSGDAARTWMKVGQPSPWMEFESRRLDFAWKLHYVTWVTPIAVGSLLVLALSRRLEEIEKGRSHSMWWHYSLWSVMLTVVIATGLLQHYMRS